MEILQDGHPILREIAKPIESILYLDELVGSMVKAMDDAEGIGLAAPQVGHSIRLFIIKPEEGDMKVFINPEILETSEDTCEYEEACLSVKDVSGVVTRPFSLKIKYKDLDFNEHTEVYDEYMARVIQHENDHLNGKLFTDYLV